MTAAADAWVLHDPRAWLGTALHRVIEAIRRGAGADQAAALWDAEIAKLASEAAQHPLDMRYSAKEKWPNYFLVRQRCLSSAAELAARLPPDRGQRLADAAPRPERRFEARNGKLTGKPDSYDGAALDEYKSTLPDPAWAGAAAIIESYERQVRIYAAIIFEAYGRWPSTARIIAASGQVHNVGIDPARCNAEADAAVSALDSFNNSLAQGDTAVQLATPSTAACGTCPFQTICPAFWSWLSRQTGIELATQAVTGILQDLRAGNDGDLYHLTLNSCVGSKAIQPLQTVTFRKSIHGTVTAPAGSAILISNAHIRADGRVYSDITTVVAAAPSAPMINVMPAS